MAVRQVRDTQHATETLNLHQRKNTPLVQVSRNFISQHPHPYIRLFLELSRSPNAIHLPQMGIWVRYEAELRAVTERLRLMEVNPATGLPYTAREAIEDVQREVSLAWERHEQSLKRHAIADEVLGS